MTFPQTPLPVCVEISLDSKKWTDITGDVRSGDQIQITRGRSDWGKQVDAGQCHLTLDNQSGNYSPRNPRGAYYGKIGRNTPLRVSVKTGDVALDLPGDPGDFASTPHTAALGITGDIDIRIDATLVNWIQQDYPSSGTVNFPRTVLVTKQDTGQFSWALYAVRSSLYFEYSTNGTSTSWFWSAADLPLDTSGRIAVRFTLDVDNGAGGHTVNFYRSDNINGPWTLLDSGTFSGLRSLFNGTAPLRIGSDAPGSTAWRPGMGLVHAVQIRNGIDGPIVANPVFTGQAPGTTSFTDSAGRPWSLSGNAEITDRKTRFVGEVSSWNTRWDTGGFDVRTEVEATGVLRRLGQGAVPTRSPMYREFTTPGRRRTGIVAYWPLEDGSDATKFASAYSNHPAILFRGTVTPAAYDGWVASDPVATIGTGSFKASVPSYDYATNGVSSLGFFCRVPPAGVVSQQRLVSCTMGGTALYWSLYVDTSGRLSLRAWDYDGTLILNTGSFLTGINGLEKYIILRASRSGANVSYAVTVVDIAQSLDTAIPDNSSWIETFTGTLTGRTAGAITEVRFGEDGLMNDTALGHLTIGNHLSAHSAAAGVLVGWNAEEAASRASRIGLEEGIHCYATGTGDEQCGPQPSGTVLEVMQAAEEVDEGILAEQRTVLGLRYITRASMYNQKPTLVLDYRGNDGLVAPLDPVEDDQNASNDITVQRTDGASGRATLDAGPLSTQPPPAGVGLYDSSYTLNLLNDGQALDHAGWRLHVGTWDEIRYPVITVDLAKAPSSIANAAKVDVGSLLRVTNPPPWLPPGPIDVLVQGYTEVLDQHTWTLAYNCTPAGPWNVAWANGDTSARAEKEFIWADTEGSQLVRNLSPTDTKVDVLTTSGPVWTPNVTDTPFDWKAGGEVMTVTAPGTLLNPNAFFESNASGWTAENSSISWTRAQVCPHPRAVGSLRIVPNGSLTGGVAGDLTPVNSVTPGASYKISMWVYSPNGWHDLQPSVHWYTNEGVYISTAGSSKPAVQAGVWTYLEDTVTAPATAGRARMRARYGSTPAASNDFYVWAVRITRSTSSWMHDTFSRTAASSWGSANTGQLWSVSGGSTSDFSVTAGYGAHILTSANLSRRSFTAFTYPDFDACVDVTTSALATGGYLSGSIAGRYTDSDNLYVARLEFTTSNTMILTLRKRVSATEVQLGIYTVPGVYTAGTWMRIRFQAQGPSFSAKVWDPATPEPGTWQITVTDTSFTTSSYVGLRSISGPGTTNVNPQIRYRNFEIVNPQTYTVTRSQNQVVKAHSAETAVALATPAYLAL